jgi:hypothetical protein
MTNNSTAFDTSEVLIDSFSDSTLENTEFDNSQIKNPFKSEKNAAKQSTTTTIKQKMSTIGTKIREGVVEFSHDPKECKRVFNLRNEDIIRNRQFEKYIQLYYNEIQRENLNQNKDQRYINELTELLEKYKKMNNIYISNINHNGQTLIECDKQEKKKAEKNKNKTSKAEFDDSSLENELKHMTIDDVLDKY